MAERLDLTEDAAIFTNSVYLLELTIDLDLTGFDLKAAIKPTLQTPDDEAVLFDIEVVSGDRPAKVNLGLDTSKLDLLIPGKNYWDILAYEAPTSPRILAYGIATVRKGVTPYGS